MNETTIHAKNLSNAACAMQAHLISHLEETSPSAVEAMAKAVKLGARQSLSITASGNTCDIDLELVNDYGERTRVLRVSV